MFLTLLLVTLILAALISALVAYLFTGPLSQILHRIVGAEIGDAWVRYMQFAIIVVGVSGGGAHLQSGALHHASLVAEGREDPGVDR